MGIVNGGDLVRRAYAVGSAVAAVNTQGGNYDIVRALVEAAAEERRPLVLQAYESNTAYYGLEWLPYVAAHISDRIGVDVGVHLDHGSSVEVCVRAIGCGFSSVMIDCSHLPLQANVEACLHVLHAARKNGVAVEAELGRLQRQGAGPGSSGANRDQEGLVDPDEVASFLAAAPVDMLAVGIGNAHGFYPGEPKIRLDLLKAVREAAGATPLVLHGTTGIPDETVRACIGLGMAKINYGTIVRSRALKHFRDALSNDSDIGGHLWKVCDAAHRRLKEDIRPILRLVSPT